MGTRKAKSHSKKSTRKVKDLPAKRVHGDAVKGGAASSGSLLKACSSGEHVKQGTLTT